MMNVSCRMQYKVVSNFLFQLASVDLSDLDFYFYCTQKTSFQHEHLKFVESDRREGHIHIITGKVTTASPPRASDCF